MAAVRKRSGAPLTDRTKSGAPRRNAGGPRPDEARLLEVERLYLALRPSGTIVREIVERFDVDERTVYNDLARVRAEHRPTPEERRERRDQHRATLVRLLASAELEGDARLARDLVADLAKLDGLNEPDKVEHSGTIQTGVLVVAQQPATADEWARTFGGVAATELAATTPPASEPTDETGGG